MKKSEHVPVLLEEVLGGLALEEGATAVDATLGGGSYTRALLEKVGKSGRVIALDADPEAILRYETLYGGRENLMLVHANYSDLDHVLEKLGIEKVQGIAADLGFSSDQINEPARGFSFEDGPLDMRLDPTKGKTAAQVLATVSEKELARILATYGDEPEAKRIARAIKKQGLAHPLTRTSELASLVNETYPRKAARRLAIHPATRVFQVLRMVVNDELEHLERFLEAATARLAPGGKLAIVAFHSGEDRLVKNFFREASRGCICPPGFPVCTCQHEARLKILTKKVIVPGAGEIERNPRARSAKLRIAEKRETKNSDRE